MSERPTGKPLRPQIGEQVEHRRIRGGIRTDRQGIDEQADHRPRGFRVRPPIGTSTAEDDITFAGISGQQDGPGRVKQSGRRQPVFGGECLKAGRLFFGNY